MSLDTWATLAAAFRELDQYRDSVGSYRQALRLGADNGACWHGLGCSLLLLQEEDQAEAAFRRALAVEPDHPGARLNLGTLLRERGPGEARFHLALLRRYDPDTAFLLEGNLV